MNDRVIFTFWEPRDRMIPYLRLCLKTWERNLPGWQVVVLDHANLSEYIAPDTYNIHALKRIMLNMQKDALQFAVHNQHGGVFMDADTIAVADISPVTARLSDTELIMFGLHMAFSAGRPGGTIVRRCVAGVREKLERLPANVNAEKDLPWHFAGNSVLHVVMADLINATPFGKATDVVLSAAFRALGRLAGGGALERLRTTVYDKRQGFFFKTALRKYLTKLDREKHGFIPELAYGWDKRMTHRDWYVRFWFESDLGVDAVFREGQTVIGLHNSWTPEWYRRLTEREVLEHPCLLSRALRHALGE
jgi:hypothetical protein